MKTLDELKEEVLDVSTANVAATLNIYEIVTDAVVNTVEVLNSIPAPTAYTAYAQYTQWFNLLLLGFKNEQAG